MTLNQEKYLLARVADHERKINILMRVVGDAAAPGRIASGFRSPDRGEDPARESQGLKAEDHKAGMQSPEGA